MVDRFYKKQVNTRNKIFDFAGIEVSNIVDLHTFPSDILERRAWKIALPKIFNEDETVTQPPSNEHVLSIGEAPHRRIGSTKYFIGWRQVSVPDRVDFPSLTLKFAENKRTEVVEYYQKWSELVVSQDGVYSYLSDSLLPIYFYLLSPNSISAPSKGGDTTAAVLTGVSSTSPIRGYAAVVFPESLNNFTLDSESGLILPSITFSVFRVVSRNMFEGKVSSTPAPKSTGQRVLTRRTI